MTKKTIFLATILYLATGFNSLSAQNLRLTFTSASEAKFFVYLNGKLQNQKSSGMVTLNNLEDKDYHVRIVIDDPYEVAVTRTIRPNKKHDEYIVKFNAVRERVYLKATSKSVADEDNNNLWIPQDPTPPQQNTTDTTLPHRTSIMRNGQSDTTNQRIINRTRTRTDNGTTF